jgi:hypothetical protein
MYAFWLQLSEACCPFFFPRQLKSESNCLLRKLTTDLAYHICYCYIASSFRCLLSAFFLHFCAIASESMSFLERCYARPIRPSLSSRPAGLLSMQDSSLWSTGYGWPIVRDEEGGSIRGSDVLLWVLIIHFLGCLGRKRSPWGELQRRGKVVWECFSPPSARYTNSSAEETSKMS